MNILIYIFAFILLLKTIADIVYIIKNKQRSKLIIELDKTHTKHLNNILDYQLIMFSCIESHDLYGVAIAHNSINEELKLIRDIIERKEKLTGA